MARAATQSISADAKPKAGASAVGAAAGAGAPAGAAGDGEQRIQLDKDVFWVAAKSADRCVPSVNGRRAQGRGCSNRQALAAPRLHAHARVQTEMRWLRNAPHAETGHAHTNKQEHTHPPAHPPTYPQSHAHPTSPRFKVNLLSTLPLARGFLRGDWFPERLNHGFTKYAFAVVSTTAPDECDARARAHANSARARACALNCFTTYVFAVVSLPVLVYLSMRTRAHARARTDKDARVCTRALAFVPHASVNSPADITWLPPPLPPC